MRVANISNSWLVSMPSSVSTNFSALEFRLEIDDFRIATDSRCSLEMVSSTPITALEFADWPLALSVCTFVEDADDSVAEDDNGDDESDESDPAVFDSVLSRVKALGSEGVSS